MTVEPKTKIKVLGRLHTIEGKTGERKMKQGPKHKPTAIKKLQGNPGGRPLPKNEPEPKIPTDIPRPPTYLGRTAKKIWRENTPKLHRIGILTEIDLPAFAMCCASFARFVDAEKQMKDAAKGKNPLTGAFQKTKHGHYEYTPLLNLAHKSINLSYRLLSGFGMFPAERGRMTVEKPKKAEDPVEKFLKRVK